MSFISDEIVSVIPKELKEDLEMHKELVESNIDYLRELGVENYQDVFKAYYPMFLMDSSNFQDIFNKYDMKDLIDKISKNIAIIEHL